MKKIVAYFSATGTTKRAAIDLAKALDADLYEIEPKVKYTSADLNWMDKKSRSSLEMKDKSSRPELANHNAHIEDYDEIYIGYPVWWYTAPTIINTFLEARLANTPAVSPAGPAPITIISYILFLHHTYNIIFSF